MQLLKARRAQFGSSREQLDRRTALIEGESLDEQRAARSLRTRPSSIDVALQAQNIE